MVDKARRWLKHLSTGALTWQRAFDTRTLIAIEAAIRDTEKLHPGEIRFAIEVSLSPAQLWHAVTPRQAAIEAFSRLAVWDTEHNNGVLIYVLLADRDVEIVVDRGVGEGRVPQSEWQNCCDLIRDHFRVGAFERGALDGIQAVADVLSRYPPSRADVGNELSDKPALL